MGVAELLMGPVAGLRPTHLFFSTGWAEEDAGCDLAAFAASAGNATRVYALNNPVRFPNGSASRPSRPAVSCGTSVFDRLDASLHLPMDEWWDGIHVLGAANEEFNHLLLDEMCGEVSPPSSV